MATVGSPKQEKRDIIRRGQLLILPCFFTTVGTEVRVVITCSQRDDQLPSRQSRCPPCPLHGGLIGGFNRCWALEMKAERRHLPNSNCTSIQHLRY